MDPSSLWWKHQQSSWRTKVEFSQTPWTIALLTATTSTMRWWLLVNHFAVSLQLSGNISFRLWHRVFDRNQVLDHSVGKHLQRKVSTDFYDSTATLGDRAGEKLVTFVCFEMDPTTATLLVTRCSLQQCEESGRIQWNKVGSTWHSYGSTCSLVLCLNARFFNYWITKSCVKQFLW